MADDKRFKPRMHRRMTVNFSAIFSLDGDLGEGVAVDVSAGGMLFRTRTSFELGVTPQFSIIYDPSEDPIILSGEVKYLAEESDPEQGIDYGVVFSDGQEPAVELLKQVLKNPKYTTRFFQKPIARPSKGKR